MVSNKECAVIFVDVEEEYSHSEQLTCKFIPNHYTPQDGDRVAMFKLGWKSVKDYILFEWAPTGLPETIEHQVVFEKHDLPKNTNELYQICYISSENVLHGATLPFKFRSEISKRRSVFPDILNFSSNESPILLSSCEDIMRLRRNKKQNEVSIECKNDLNKLSRVFPDTMNYMHKDCEKEIADLKLQIEILRKTVATQENEINFLRSRKRMFPKRIDSIQNSNSSRVNSHDLGELEAIPPFPLDL